MANTKNIENKLKQVKENTSQIVAEINALKTAGKSATEIYAQMASKIQSALKNITSVAGSAKKSFEQNKKGQEQYIKNLDVLSSKFAKLEAAKTKMFVKAEKERTAILRQQQNLRNQITAGNKERTKKVNDFQKEQAKRRVDVLSSIEKKYQDKNLAIQKAAERNQIESFKRIEKAQRELRDGIAKRNKTRTTEVNNFQVSQAKRREKVLADIEKRKEAQLNAAQKRRERIQIAWDKRRQKMLRDQNKLNAAEAKKNDFAGGLRAQFTPRAIGGAIGSLAKYVGIYKLAALAAGAFNKAVVESVKVSIDFEKQLANLGAVSGATTEDVQKLKKAALDTAGATTFTASQIVGLQVSLSKLGFTAEQVVASTKAIAFTAQALGEPLDAVATLTGKIINQFGLLAEESGLVSDVLVTTINNSALSLNTFGTAIQYVGPLAAELGFEFQETAAAMAVLADNGFTASRVGTGLRGIFTELGKTSASVRKEIEELAKRNLSLAEAVDLVGKRNAAQLLTLTRNIDLIRENNDAYYEQGRAIESASKQIDTVSGHLQLLSSHFNEVQISIGDAIIQTEFFTDVLRFLSPTVAMTVDGFKAFRNVGVRGFNRDIAEIADGADATVIALESLAESATNEKTAADFNRLLYQLSFKSEAYYKDTQSGLYTISDDLKNTLSNDTMSILQGYIDLLNEATETEIKNRAAKEGRQGIDDVFEDDIDRLQNAQRAGIDVTAEANAEAEKAAILLASYGDALKNNTSLTELDRIMIEAQKEQTQKYLNILTNILGVQKNLNEENSTGTKKRTFDVSAYEKEIKLLEEQYERLKLLNELNESEVATGSGLLLINKSKIETYDELISRLKSTKNAIEGEIEATDLSTTANRKQVAVHKQEIQDLDKLIAKYSERKEALSGTLGLLEDIFAQGEKDLKRAAKSKDSTPELKIEEQTKIIDRLSAQLLEAAGDDPQLKAIAEAYIGGLYVNMQVASEKEANQLKAKQTQLLSEIAKYAAEAASAYNQTALENKKAFLDAEMEAIKNKFKVEEQILKSSLDNQLITESQFRIKSEELRKKQLQQENEINEKIFKEEKKADSTNVIINTLEAIASNAIENYGSTDTVTATGLTAAGYAAITAAGALKLDAIRRRKFYPVQFEEGGIVNGPSHAQGGIPFSVQGNTGYEMEGGEFIVNKNAASLHRQLLESINNSSKPIANQSPVKFATGGTVNNTTNVNRSAGESVHYLKAIAEATSSTAIGVSKPVRAFVTERDLRTSATERKIKDRNTTI